jgi:serine/threonine-protein kinase HipA
LPRLASLELALEVAGEFGLKQAEAKTVARGVGAAVSQWKQTANQMGIADRAVSKMASAFEHMDLEMARAV